MCGIAAVMRHPRAWQLALRLAGELRHRGQGRLGIAVSSGNTPKVFREDPGLLLSDPAHAQRFFGHIALVHARYPTSGSQDRVSDSQPAFADGIGRRVVLVENGDTPVLEQLRDGYEGLESNTEAEVIARMIVSLLEQGNSMVDALRHLQTVYDGAYSIILLDGEHLYLTRDPHGFRPLWYGEGIRDGAHSFFAAASEDNALRSIGVTPIREVDPGEILVVGPNGIEQELGYGATTVDHRAHCLFEAVYFAGIASRVFGIDVELFRYHVGLLVGQRLRSIGLDAELVAPVPDSSNPFAEGVSHGLQRPLTFAVIRTHTTRTFIETHRDRPRRVEQKFKVSKRIAGKRVVLCDDSIVRGSTSRRLADLVRSRGQPAKLYLAVGSDAIVSPCYYGIDMKDPAKLAARAFWRDGKVDVMALRDHLGFDGLTYATLGEMQQVLRDLGADPRDFCTACWTGKYPTPGGQALAPPLGGSP